MATYTKLPIKCNCGHTGFVVCKETDQPYGGDWTSYTLQGFGRQQFCAETYFKRPDAAKLLKLRCPACNKTGLVKASDDK